MRTTFFFLALLGCFGSVRGATALKVTFALHTADASASEMLFVTNCAHASARIRGSGHNRHVGRHLARSPGQSAAGRRAGPVVARCRLHRSGAGAGAGRHTDGLVYHHGYQTG